MGLIEKKELNSYIDSRNNSLLNNIANMNKLVGISNSNSFNTTMKNNSMSANLKYNFGVSGQLDSHFNNKIDTSNTVDGKVIYYLVNITDNIYDSSNNAGTFYCISCNNVTIKDLFLTKTQGVMFWNTTNSKIINITSLNSNQGIYLGYSDNNELKNNNVLTNSRGIYLKSSSGNLIINNNASFNNGWGIWLDSSNNNSLHSNTVNSNYPPGTSSGTGAGEGIELVNSNNNSLANNIINFNNYIGIAFWYSNNNNVMNNKIKGREYENGIYIDTSISNNIYNNYINTSINHFYSFQNNINTTKIPGINIVGGSFLAGNYWANPSGTGFSQTCADVNKDGICDSSFTPPFGTVCVDYLPLTIPAGYSYISGAVLNNDKGIAGATVSTNTTITTNTDASYLYSLLVPAGNYRLSATSEPRYYPNSSVTLNVGARTTVIQDIQLQTKYGFLNGSVLHNGSGVAGAVVITNTSASNTTNSLGFYSFDLIEGNYNLTVTSEPIFYRNSSITLTVIPNSTVVQDIELLKKPTGNITGSVTSV